MYTDSLYNSMLYSSPEGASNTERHPRKSEARGGPQSDSQDIPYIYFEFAFNSQFKSMYMYLSAQESLRQLLRYCKAKEFTSFGT